MKVLIVCSGLGLGGAERQIVLLAREFDRRGHAVRIYTLNKLLARADELRGTGVEIEADQKRSRLDLALIRRLRRSVIAWQPDIVHTFLYDADIFARLACISLGLPLLSSERSDNYRVSAVQKFGYRLTRSLSDGLVANSRSGAEFGAALHGRTPEHTHVVYNGIDLQEIRRRLSESTQPALQYWPGESVRRICMVGSIGPAKDHPLALRALRAALDHDPAWRLICVGDALPGAGDDYKSKVLALAQELGVGHAVAFAGHRRDVPELIASSDVQLVTSVREGFPNVVLEAMACGTPVVTTEYSDVRDIVPNGWQVVAERSPVALVAALERCIREAPAVRAAQRAWVDREGTIEASASAMLDVYGRYVQAKCQLGIAQ